MRDKMISFWYFYNRYISESKNIFDFLYCNLNLFNYKYFNIFTAYIFSFNNFIMNILYISFLIREEIKERKERKI